MIHRKTAYVARSPRATVPRPTHLADPAPIYVIGPKSLIDQDLGPVSRNGADDILRFKAWGNRLANECAQTGIGRGMKKFIIAALALATALTASPAFSQIYFEYGTGPRYYDRPPPRYYRYPPRYAYDDDYGAPRYRHDDRCWTQRYYAYRHHRRVVRYRTVCD